MAPPPLTLPRRLGASTATPQNPVVYDLAIKMANSSAGTQRFSFALATAEGDATTWDFGVQVYRGDSSYNFYTIGKRIDTGSSGQGSDINAPITNTASATYGTEISLPDARDGCRGGDVGVSLAGAALAGWRQLVVLRHRHRCRSAQRLAAQRDGPLHPLGRRAAMPGNVTYDSFSLTSVPAGGDADLAAGNAATLAPLRS